MTRQTHETDSELPVAAAAGGLAPSPDVLGRVLDRSERRTRELLAERFTMIERLITRRQEARLASGLIEQEAEAVIDRRRVEISAALDGLRTELRAILAARSAELGTDLTAHADRLMNSLIERLSVSDLDRHERDEELIENARKRLHDPRRVQSFERRLEAMRDERETVILDLLQQTSADLRRLRDAYQVTGARR